MRWWGFPSWIRHVDKLSRILKISALAVESLSFAPRAKQVMVLLAIVSVNQLLPAFYGR